MQNKHKNKKSYSVGNKMLILMYLVIILIISVSGGMFGYSRYIQNELEKLQLEIVGNSAYVYAYETISIKQTQYEDVKKYNEMILDGRAQIQAIPQLTNLEYVTLKNYLSDDMQILSMNYSNGIYIITFTAPLPRKVPEYIANIKKTGIFENVTYNGFSMQTYRNIGNADNLSVIGIENLKQYVFTATCTLKSGVHDEIK